MNDAAATPTPKAPDTRHYKVRDRITGDVIYVVAVNRNQAHSFAAYKRFETSILSVKEALGLKEEDVLDATQQPGPPAQLKLDVPAPQA
jgi:hypothetical protein